jgi:hypothetical protein
MKRNSSFLFSWSIFYRPGITSTLFFNKIASASGVVGPLAEKKANYFDNNTKK